MSPIPTAIALAGLTEEDPVAEGVQEGKEALAPRKSMLFKFSRCIGIPAKSSGVKPPAKKRPTKVIILLMGSLPARQSPMVNTCGCPLVREGFSVTTSMALSSGKTI
jgi:hypothetical protein